MFSCAGVFLLLLASHPGWPACETPYKSHSQEYLLVRYVALGQHARTNGNIQRLWCKRRFPVKQDKQVINCITLGLAIYGWSIVILLSCFRNILFANEVRCSPRKHPRSVALYGLHQWLAINPTTLFPTMTAMNDDLIKLLNWCFNNRLLLNPDKTKLIKQ